MAFPVTDFLFKTCFYYLQMVLHNKENNSAFAEKLILCLEKILIHEKSVKTFLALNI